MEKEEKNKKSLIIILVIVGVLVLFVGAASAVTFGFHRVGTKNLSGGLNRGSGRGMMGGGFDRGGMMGYSSKDFRGVRISGDITKIDGNTLTVKGVKQDYTVTVADTTSYSKNRDVAKQSDLKVNNSVIIRGTSDSQGVISAVAIVIN